jgi:hypothetical protein
VSVPAVNSSLAGGGLVLAAGGVPELLDPHAARTMAAASAINDVRAFICCLSHS